MNFEKLLHTGFDRALESLEIIETGGGSAKARVRVNDAIQNIAGTLHGGAIATLVDNIGTLAVVSNDRYRRLGVTTDLNVSYLTPARSGDSVLITAELVMCGLNLSFVDVALTCERSGRLFARGRMTQFLGSARSWAPD